ncbi:phosphatase PAP2 family protein [Vibrio taketomensis]|uniref:phosphatase PAP2 family protein n=1 Tax=Vibrio taketomensis TaxID=2572923 RepID=UPI001389EECE|nr:phosphatase PAP2 family protein [Vibrio taketomensis]
MRAIEPIAKFDLAFSLMCLQNKHRHLVSRLSKAISHTGDGHLYVLLGVLALWLDGQHGRYFLLSGLLAFVIELPCYWLLKNTIKRRRPNELTGLIPAFITPSDKYSLPSGHTAAAFVIAILLSHFYPQLAAFAFVWASMIAFARILLGVHFFSDVVLGACLGIATATFALQWFGV